MSSNNSQLFSARENENSTLKRNLWKIDTGKVKGFRYDLEDQTDNVTVRSSEIDEFEEKKPKAYSNTI